MRWLIVSLVCISSLAFAQLPSEQQWLRHVASDLSPFWMMKSAQGDPLGDFPTFRCNDGALIDPDNLCKELGGSWIKEKIGREYIRMKSRQTFAYGVIFHMTGDPAALKLMKAGVDFLLNHGIDKQNGGFYSYLVNGKPGLQPEQRTSQSQSYGLIGLSFYYYLTRDAQVLPYILRAKDYIFSHYYDQKMGMLRWVNADSAENKKNQQELVSQLDQINAYMLLLTPILPEPYQSQWKTDLARLEKILLTRFYDKDEQRFYGFIHNQTGTLPTSRHGDWGHTVKSFWMVYKVSQLLGDKQNEQLAYKGIESVLERAYNPLDWSELPVDIRATAVKGRYGYWAGSVNSRWSAWWQYAELDQAAANLSLRDSKFTSYLKETYPTWINFLVDKQYGEMRAYPAKQHQWRNGYHSMEHALVGYIISQALRKQSSKLYFAVEDPSKYRLQPYIYQGDVSGVQAQVRNGTHIQRLSFTAVR